jgi:succinate dehydrogenase / fumarate reductase, cytochrome b subunit
MTGPGMRFWESSVGRKVLISITGAMMVIFVVFHALGNSTIYFHWINAYSEHLHALPALIWLYRVFMLVVLLVHVFFGIQLTLENKDAKPLAYVCKRNLRATFASKNMIWTGTIIAIYLVYHLLHFTLQVINTEFSASQHADALGRPDVYEMVVRNFQNFFISLIYIFAMTALALHLTHGIQSLFQTFGLNTEKTLPVIIKVGAIAAIILSLGYISIPVLVLTGILKG